MGSKEGMPGSQGEEKDLMGRILATRPHDPWWKLLANLTLRAVLLAASIVYSFVSQDNLTATIGISVILLLPVYDAAAAINGKVRLGTQSPGKR